MKKLALLIGTLTLFICITGCDVKKETRLIEITYKEFKEKVDNKETFFVEIIQTGCSACESFAPKYKEVLKEYNLISYQLNFTNMSEEDYQNFNKDWNVAGTPTVIFITDGTEITTLQRITSNIAKSKIISKLKSNGYIKNDSE